MNFVSHFGENYLHLLDSRLQVSTPEAGWDLTVRTSDLAWVSLTHREGARALPWKPGLCHWQVTSPLSGPLSSASCKMQAGQGLLRPPAKTLEIL